MALVVNDVSHIVYHSALHTHHDVQVVEPHVSVYHKYALTLACQTNAETCQHACLSHSAFSRSDDNFSRHKILLCKHYKS